jgi:predicted deacetylase
MSTVAEKIALRNATTDVQHRRRIDQHIRAHLRAKAYGSRYYAAWKAKRQAQREKLEIAKV